MLWDEASHHWEIDRLLWFLKQLFPVFCLDIHIPVTTIIARGLLICELTLWVRLWRFSPNSTSIQGNFLATKTLSDTQILSCRYHPSCSTRWVLHMNKIISLYIDQCTTCIGSKILSFQMLHGVSRTPYHPSKTSTPVQAGFSSLSGRRY